MAISEGGLLTDEIRCQVWPWLLNVLPHVLEQEPGIIIIIIISFSSSGSIAHTLLLYLTQQDTIATDAMPTVSRVFVKLTANCPLFFFLPEPVERDNNKDYNQVLLDVQRSLRRFPPGE